MSLPDKFTMPFEPTTIDHLGLRLYSTLPPVIGEFVSNARDAESKKAEVTLPVGSITSQSEVIVRDYGHGLTAEELQNEFLPIGRARRGPKSANVWSKNRKVRVTGRKGLGKLSAFGVAVVVEVCSFKDGEAICLRLNYNEIRKWPAKHPGMPYEPEIVKERTGVTSERNGVEIRLKQLHRTRSINADDVRKGLARRLSFIGSQFQVYVNEQAIKPGDRVQRSQCPKNYSWDASDLPMSGKVGEKMKVTGWVGFLAESSQINRGVDIFANEKAAELGSFFNLATTHAQYARAHLVGEIHANFLDQKNDQISTARNSVVWESDEGQALQAWGQKALVWAFDRWLELRKKEKEKDLVTSSGFDNWLKTRQRSEQRVARRMVSILVDDPNIDPSSAAPLFEIVKSSVEAVAFRDLVDTIETEGSHPGTLLQLFEEWRVIEAREHLKLADGRLEAIGQLKAFMDGDALEVQQMQPLFEEHPWLIDHAWSEVEAQTTYTEQLRKHCKEPRNLPEEERRIDILGIRLGGEITVVEIKRPKKTENKHDLRQIADYVDWARANLLSTGPDSPRAVRGLLIVGKLNKQKDVAEERRRLAGDDIRVERYEDLHHRAKEYYELVERTLEKVAPEYTRKRRKAAKKAK
jgi:Histidine kinase-, DNA gyrase B-, and HSP90-like ATPase